MQEKKRVAALFALCAIALAACGGWGGEEAAAPPTAGPAPGPAPAPSPAVSAATLQWNSSGDTRVQGYRVYYGTVSGQYVQAKGGGLSTTGTAYTIQNLTAGRTYYFAVTAYDATGGESDYSSEASKVVN